MAKGRRWLWAPVLVVGAVLYLLLLLALEDTQDVIYVPSVILVGAAVVLIAFVTFIAGRRLAFGVGGAATTSTALLGGVIGVLSAGTPGVRDGAQPRRPAAARGRPDRGGGEVDHPGRRSAAVARPSASCRWRAPRRRRGRGVRRSGDHGVDRTGGGSAVESRRPALASLG